MKRLSIIILVIVCVGPTLATGQTLPDEFPGAQSLFARAQRLMREKDYLGAIDAYDKLVTGYKNSQYRDIYHFGLARALYHSGDFKNAEQTLANFHTLFPRSYLGPYASHLMANCEYRQARLEAAFRNYLRAYGTAEDSRLRGLSEQSLLAAVEAGYIPPDSVLSFVPADLICRLKARIVYLMSRHWSKSYVDSFMVGCPKSLYEKEKKPVVSKAELSVGLMLPLTGPYAKYGQAVLDGAMLAAETLPQEGISIELSVYDTRADNVIAARQALALAEANVDVIVGPLLSSVAATAAAALSCSRIPLLVPAAAQAGFTDLSPYCFQMTPNVITIGRGLAQYAVRNRGMTTLAVITPTSLDEMTMAEAFAAEAERLGARVLAVEKFRPDETDFGPYINDIKEALLGPSPDSTFYLTLDGDTLKPGEMPVSFDGLFIPATEQQLFLLLPQLNFYRVTTSYLGTDEWNTDKVLKLGEKVLRDAVFYSSKGAMHFSEAYDRLAAAYDAKYGTAPDRLVALGYDAVNLLAQAYREGRRTSIEIGEHFRRLDRGQGASGNFTFGQGRSNLELPLFTLREDQVRPLVEPARVEEPPEEELPPDSVGVEHINYEQ